MKAVKAKIELAKLSWNDGERFPYEFKIVSYPEVLAKKLIDRHSGVPDPMFIPMNRLSEFGIKSEPVKSNEEIEAERLAKEAKIKAEQDKQREFEEMKAENERLKALAANKPDAESKVEATKTEPAEKKVKKVREPKIK